MNRFCCTRISIFLWGVFGTLFAAGEETLPIPPRAPFVQNAPPCAEWTVICEISARATSDGKVTLSPGGSTVRRLKEVHVTKMDDTRRDVCIWSDGSETERWKYQGMILFECPGISDIDIQSKNQAGGEDLPSDFPELGWVSAKTFVGTERYKDRLCHHYQLFQSGQNAGGGGAKSRLDAWIDGATGWPVAIDNGRTLLVFSFKAVPQRKLELPERFDRALKDFR